MRKTSHDGGDTSSITSGVENETKKPGGIMKSKKNSIKRKVQNLSHESDDAVIEPLLQKDMEKTDMSKQSAKYDLLSKTKTDATTGMGNETERLLQGDKTQKSTLTDVRNVDDTFKPMPSTSKLAKSTSGTAPLHNYMNTNVFSSHDTIKGLITTKSQILVEIDSSKQSGYNPSPLIFTTAKIHTDGKNKNMEPFQVTAVPILSTIEVSVLKGTSINNNAEKYGNKATSNTNIPDRDQISKSTLPGIVTTSNKMIDKKALNTTENQFVCSVMPTKDKKDLKTESIAMKDFIIESKSAVYDHKDNKKTENNSVNTESKKEDKQTKLSLSQPIGLSSTTTTGCTEGAFTAVSSKNTLKTQADKDNISIKSNQKELSKCDALNMIEPKTDVNKNITPIDGPSHITLKDKVSVNTVSTGTKQLQRQKFAIDKDDTKSLKTSLDSSSLNYNTTSTPNSMTQTKPLGCDESRFSDKTKLPISTANNVQKTSHTATSTKPSVSTVSKPTTANAITSTKTTFTCQSSATAPSITPVTKIADIAITSTVAPSLIAKQQSSNMITGTDANKKDISSANSQTPSTVTSKPLTSDTKMVTMSAAGIQCSTTKPVSNAKPTTIHHDTKATIAKPMPQTKVTKSTDIGSKVITTSINAAKSQPVSVISVKSSPATISSTKTPPVFAGAAKSPPPTTIATKIPPAATSTAKHQAVASTIAKNSPAVSSTAKILPVHANVAKSTSASATGTEKSLPAENTTAKTSAVVTSTVKTLPVTTSTAKMPVTNTSSIKMTTAITSSAKSQPPTTNTAKSPPPTTSTAKISAIVTNTVKTPTVNTITAKSPPVSISTSKSTSSTKTPSLSTTTVPKSSTTKSNNTSASKAGVASHVPSTTATDAVSTVTSAATTGITSGSTVSNKKPEAKSTELSNGKKV